MVVSAGRVDVHACRTRREVGETDWTSGLAGKAVCAREMRSKTRLRVGMAPIGPAVGR